MTALEAIDSSRRALFNAGMTWLQVPATTRLLDVMLSEACNNF